MNLVVTTLPGGRPTAGCTAQVPGFPVVPALPAETRPLPPVSEQPLIWQPGDWVFAGESYRYEPGHYIASTGREHTWVFGHWGGTSTAPVWLPGGWAS